MLKPNKGIKLMQLQNSFTFGENAQHKYLISNYTMSYENKNTDLRKEK